MVFVFNLETNTPSNNGQIGAIATSVIIQPTATTTPARSTLAIDHISDYYPAAAGSLGSRRGEFGSEREGAEGGREPLSRQIHTAAKK